MLEHAFLRITGLDAASCLTWHTNVYTIICMRFEWDENKRAANLKKHGVDFVAACSLWNRLMLTIEDTRTDYNELRLIGMGLLKKRVMVVVFTERQPDIIRIISFRKANRREIEYYEKTCTRQ